MVGGGQAGRTARDTVQQAGRVADDPRVERLARLGFVVYGVVHLVLGWLALQVAWGGSGEEASTSGAVETLAEQPLGLVLVWAVAVGMALLSLWQLSEAVIGGHAGSDGHRAAARVKAAAKAVTYGVIAAVAARVALGGGSGGGSGEEEAASTLMDLPGGRFLVGAVGLVTLAVGAYHVKKGIGKDFLDDLEPGATSGSHGTWVERLGQVGYAAKGVALGIVGVLFLVAAWEHDEEAAGGLDAALRTLKEQPFGPWLLTMVGLGIAAYGVYCFARARYERT
ncbi:MAG TPA: DUF1206 domain-containing protein [Jiangellales bacterium]|nr:DUF1206 domain-containing protein [Jiangellales bacterium]